MRVFVKSFGCSSNLADEEYMRGCLLEADYQLVDSESEAELLIYNTCAVKGPTENRVINVLKKAPKDKKLVVTGCLPLINFERLEREVQFNGVVGPSACEKIVEVAKRVSNGEKIVMLKKAFGTMPSLSLSHVRLNPLIGIIPINYGCLGSCAYCCVAFARGRLRSHRIDDVVERARKDVATGARELWITSQDTACYGRDKGNTLDELMESLCEIKGDFMIRVGMMTPDAALSILEDLIQAFHDDHVFKFIHLPVQSGDNQVLKRMRRFYSVDDFRSLVNAFRTNIRQVTLSTDIICGFPSESDEAFDNTIQLVTEIKPDIVNISKFFARPRTPAFGMQEHFVPTEEIRRRSNRLAEVAKKVSLGRNEAWVGWVGSIIVDEVGKAPGSWVGRNAAYKPVVIESSDNLFGRKLLAEITKAFPTYLEGRLVA